MSFSLFAVTAPGLEGLCADELRDLGLGGRAVSGGVAFSGGWSNLMKAHLYGRIPGRILVRLGEFTAKSFAELERKQGTLPWKDFSIPGHRVIFRVSCRASTLYHSGAVSERLIKWLERDHGIKALETDDEDNTEEGTSLFVVRIDHNTVTISADASGSPLHKRGYREFSGKAPMRENLAPAFLKALGWTALDPLADLFCGSGTIPIEAALMARNIPPALAKASREPREFAFTRWPHCPPGVWKALCDQARKAILPLAPAPILASDRDAGAMKGAIENARRAGVDQDIQFQQGAFSTITLGSGPGFILSNPPYGKRVGEAGDLRDLYAGLGNYLRRSGSQKVLGLFCPEKFYIDATGLESKEILVTNNGGLRVSLYSCNQRPSVVV